MWFSSSKGDDRHARIAPGAHWDTRTSRTTLAAREPCAVAHGRLTPGDQRHVWAYPRIQRRRAAGGRHEAHGGGRQGPFGGPARAATGRRGSAAVVAPTEQRYAQCRGTRPVVKPVL